MTDRVVAVMGAGLVDAEQPVLRADDLGVLRGDGIFETLLVRDGVPRLLDEHLARLAASARRMELSAPDPVHWRTLVDTVVAAWPRDAEGVLRLVCTRGAEYGGPPTAYATIADVPPGVLRQREDGIRVISRSLGLPADARSEAPWLLGGVKTTSYAIAMSALREAARHQADDVLWLSADGEVLEGPTASVVWSRGRALYTVPVETGILSGTTVAHLMRVAPQRGFTVGTRRARLADLHAADGIWFLSSVRGAVPVCALDGRERGEAGLTGEIRRLLGLG